MEVRDAGRGSCTAGAGPPRAGEPAAGPPAGTTVPAGPAAFRFGMIKGLGPAAAGLGGFSGDGSGFLAPGGAFSGEPAADLGTSPPDCRGCGSGVEPGAASLSAASWGSSPAPLARPAAAAGAPRSAGPGAASLGVLAGDTAGPRLQMSISSSSALPPSAATGSPATHHCFGGRDCRGPSMISSSTEALRFFAGLAEPLPSPAAGARRHPPPGAASKCRPSPRCLVICGGVGMECQIGGGLPQARFSRETCHGRNYVVAQVLRPDSEGDLLIGQGVTALQDLPRTPFDGVRDARLLRLGKWIRVHRRSL